MKCKHNFRVDSNFLACSVFSFFFLFSNIKVFRSCPPGGRERKEIKKKKKNPTVRDFVTVPVIRVRYIDVKKNKKERHKITQRIGNFPIDVIVSENEIAKLFFLSRFDTPLALASLLLLLLLLFAELLFKWNGERKEKIKRKGKKRIERTRR